MAALYQLVQTPPNSCQRGAADPSGKAHPLPPTKPAESCSGRAHDGMGKNRHAYRVRKRLPFPHRFGSSSRPSGPAGFVRDARPPPGTTARRASRELDARPGPCCRRAPPRSRVHRDRWLHRPGRRGCARHGPRRRSPRARPAHARGGCRSAGSRTTRRRASCRAERPSFAGRAVVGRRGRISRSDLGGASHDPPRSGGVDRGAGSRTDSGQPRSSPSHDGAARARSGTVRGPGPGETGREARRNHHEGSTP